MIKFNKEFFVGITLGFGAGVAYGAMVGKDKQSLKAMSKEVIRVTLLSYEKLKESIARARENFEDLTAEVKSEIQTKAVADAFDGRELGEDVLGTQELGTH